MQLPVFEGPLDLLLQLVKVNKVEIGDIPVAVVCDQFHEYLSLMEEMNLDIAAEYIYEAAMLIHLKSKLLLHKRRTEDGQPAEDPRQELVKRLLEYRRLKDASQSLAEIHSMRVGVWTRRPQRIPAVAEGEEPELDLEEVSLFDLLQALRDVLARYDLEHPEPIHLSRETYSVREQFERLVSELEVGRPFDLLDDLRGLRSRGEIVAAFLAVLEAIRMSVVRLHQSTAGEIHLYRTNRQIETHELEAVQA